MVLLTEARWLRRWRTLRARKSRWLLAKIIPVGRALGGRWWKMSEGAKPTSLASCSQAERSPAARALSGTHPVRLGLRVEFTVASTSSGGSFARSECRARSGRPRSKNPDNSQGNVHFGTRASNSGLKKLEFSWRNVPIPSAIERFKIPSDDYATHNRARTRNSQNSSSCSSKQPLRLPAA